MKEPEISQQELNLCDIVMSRFKSANSFVDAQFIFSTEDFYLHVSQIVPIDLAKDHFLILMENSGFSQTHNEHNNKYYWLLNPKTNNFLEF